MAAALALGVEIFSQGFRFLPTPHDAVTYYLPRLVAGTPLHNAVRPVIHHADVYACAPGDLARHFRPLPRTGDRFFFTPSAASRKQRAANRDGSWHAQNTTDIKGCRGGHGDGDVKVGELRKLRYKKSGGAYTDWLMDEYSCCSVAGESSQFVLCKMYVSPRAALTSAAHKESAAFFSFTLQPPPVAVVMQMQMRPAPTVAPKRPAVAPMSPPCAKRMRRAPIVQPAGGNVSFSMPPPPQPSCAPPPVVLPTRSPLAAVGKMPLAPPRQPPPLAPPVPTLSSFTAGRNMPLAPPHPSAPRRGSTTESSPTQPSLASAPPAAPPAPTRPPLAAVRTMSSTPPQLPSAAPPHSSRTPLATQPSPASALHPAPPVPMRPAMQPHRSPVPMPGLPTPPVARACHVPLQVSFSMPPSQWSCAPPTVVPARSPLAAVGKIPLEPPPQPYPIRPAMRPQRSPMPLPAPQQQPLPQQVQVPLPTPPVVHVPVESKQRRILDPFEAADMMTDEGEDQTAAAPPHPPPAPAATTSALQDQDEDDWADLDKALDFED